jgi:DNA-binding beta-propeller fold protein YncE
MLVMPDGSLLFSQSLTSYSVIFRLPNRCSGVVLTKLVTQNLLHPYQLAHNGRGTLYVTNQNSNAVTRYNLTTGNPVGPNALFVTVTNPRGVAINAAGTRVYVAARDDGLLIEYDEASGVQLRSWPVPAPIYVLVANGLVVVDSASDNTVRVIDPVSGRYFFFCFFFIHFFYSGTEIRRLSVSGLLHGAGMTITSNNTLLVWSQDTSQIYAWDFATFSSLGLWKGGFSILPQGLTEVE